MVHFFLAHPVYLSVPIKVQHHDAITGTMSPKVYNMYHSHLVSSRNQTVHAMVKMIEDLMGDGRRSDYKIRLAEVSSQDGQG